MCCGLTKSPCFPDVKKRRLKKRANFTVFNAIIYDVIIAVNNIFNVYMNNYGFVGLFATFYQS